MAFSRRQLLGLGIGSAALAGLYQYGRGRLLNPCLAALPSATATHPLLAAAWTGVDPAKVWDCHTHLAGTGDSGSGIVVGPQMSTPLRPFQYAQRLFYMNAGCAHQAPGRVDASYVERLHNLLDGMPSGVKLLLFAFDYAHDEQGRALPEHSAFRVPDAYARDIASKHPTQFEWAASIHPYAPDAVDRLQRAVAEGARAIKWLPAAMGIDPSSARCDGFYRAMARHDLPLISHAGEEKAVKGGDSQRFGNPLLLRRALDAGVRVVVAHCASIGEDADSDKGQGAARVPSIDLFARLMHEPRARGRLFGDISAITLRNRDAGVIRRILAATDWHPQLLNGSDYPLPGILPLISLSTLVRENLLAEETVPVLDEVRRHNPLLFDFALKRHLAAQGARFPVSIFETRPFFERKRS